MGALNSKTLVLNKSWNAIGTTTAKDAISKVYAGYARILDKNYMLYTFEDWLDNWSDVSAFLEIAEEKIIHGGTIDLVIPEIIVLTGHSKYRFHKGFANLNRRNLYVRDNDTCQYCSKKLKRNELNIDHVLPKSRGGGTSWENLVISCIHCNAKKDNMTPKEAGMHLLRKPYRPHWSEIIVQSYGEAKPPDSWKTFISEVYWKTARTPLRL